MLSCGYAHTVGLNRDTKSHGTDLRHLQLLDHLIAIVGNPLNPRPLTTGHSRQHAKTNTAFIAKFGDVFLLRS